MWSLCLADSLLLAYLLIQYKNAKGRKYYRPFFQSWRFVVLNYNCSQNVFVISNHFGDLRVRAMMFWFNKGKFNAKVGKLIANFSIKFYKFLIANYVLTVFWGNRTAVNTVDTAFNIFFCYVHKSSTTFWCLWKPFSWQGAYAITEFSLNMFRQ